MLARHKGLVVFFILLFGVLSFFLIQEPHSPCDTTFESFRKAQEGFLFPKTIKSVTRQPLYKKTIEMCKLGNSPGACYEHFNGLKKVMRDVSGIPNSCGDHLSKLPELSSLISENLKLMIEIAWGESPPASNYEKTNWLEASDLALFCQLRDEWIRLAGDENYTEFKTKIQNGLPGEKPTFADGECTNCDRRKKAIQLLSIEEIWKVSLLSLDCRQYR